jgi:hypothetical protein
MDGEVVEQSPGCLSIGFAAQEADRALQQLQCLDAVSRDAVNSFAAAALETAVEFTTDHVAVVRETAETVGGRLEEPPILVVCRDNGVAQGVDLVLAVEVAQGLHGSLEIVAGKFGIVIRIEGQPAKDLERVAMVAGCEGRLGLCPQIFGRRIAGKDSSEGTQPDQQND